MGTASHRQDLLSSKTRDWIYIRPRVFRVFSTTAHRRVFRMPGSGAKRRGQAFPVGEFRLVLFRSTTGFILGVTIVKRQPNRSRFGQILDIIRFRFGL